MTPETDSVDYSGKGAMIAMLRDVGILLKGTILAQALGFLFVPILSRIYDPSAFGDFAVYQAALLIVTVIACLRFDQAILTAGDYIEAVDLFILCCVVASGVALLVLIGVLIFTQLPSLNQSFLGTLSIFWLVPATLVAGLSLAASALFTRMSEFKISASSKMFQSAANGGIAIPVGLLAPIPAGLVLADMAGKTIVIWIAIRHCVLPNRTSWNAKRLKALATTYSQFPKISVLGGLLNNGGSFLTPVVVYHIYGAHLAGQYSLVDRAVGLPLGLLVVTLSQAFSAHFGRLLRENPQDARAYFTTLVGRCALFGLIPVAGLLLTAPLLFPFIFGKAWQVAGLFAQILALNYLSAIIVGPVMTALVIAGKLGWQMFWELGRLVLLTLLWVIVAQNDLSIESALFGYSAASAAVNIIFVGLVWLHLNQRQV
jgi:O-antigen/teichoic acid export membrane protein